MNTRELHIALLDDLEVLFKDRPFKTPHETMETPKTYPQDLPPHVLGTVGFTPMARKT